MYLTIGETLSVGGGVTLTPHPLLVPRSRKQRRAIPLLSLRAFVACEKVETYQILPPFLHLARRKKIITLQ
jgi:hypothetical protein